MAMQASDIQRPLTSTCCDSAAPSFPTNANGDAVMPSVSLSYLCEGRPCGATSSPLDAAVVERGSGFPGFPCTSGNTINRDRASRAAKGIIATYGMDLAWYRVYAGRPLVVLQDGSEARAVFEALADEGVEVDPSYLVVQASQRGHQPVVELAIELAGGVPADVVGGWWAESMDRAIAEAVLIGSVEIAQLLFEYGARIHRHTLVGGPDGTDAVYRAASKGHDGMADWLITVAQIYGPPSF